MAARVLPKNVSTKKPWERLKEKLAYPMYVIPVKSFLEMEGWVPHQEALAAGMVLEYDHDKMEDKVIFISHQWSGWLHPDPKLEQMASLKGALNQLMDGKTTVRSNAMLEMGYDWHVEHSGKWWKENLPQMFMWIDFSSMPQPLAARFAGLSQAQRDLAMAAEKRARHAGMVEALEAQEEGGVGKVSHSGTDHRLVEDKEEEVTKLVKQLTTAVDCIPGYIQRCAMMWVLVPPIEHADVDKAVCDYTSWRSRGWCRMEFKASKLKAGIDMPVMVLDGSYGGQLTYINPCDSCKLNPQNGSFSVEGDRPKVQQVLNELYEQKTKSYIEEHDDLVAYRVVKLMRAASTSKYEYTEEELAVDGETAVARVKEALLWRDEATEEAWMKKQGISLLLCAVCLNDRAAVRELLGRPDAKEALAMYAKPPYTAKERAAEVYRHEPFATLYLKSFDKLSPTCAALALADAETFQMVLAARPPPPGLLTGKDCNDFWASPMSMNDLKPYQQLVEAFPKSEYGPMFAKSMNGFSWIMMTTLCLADEAPEMIDFLVENGAGKGVNELAMGATTLIFAIMYNPELGLATIRKYVEAGADVNKKDSVPTAMKYLSGTLGSLGVKSMRGMSRFMAAYDMGGTPLHHAAKAGNVVATRALVELGADVTIKDRSGATPADVARARHPGTATEALLVASLEGGKR